jgi:uncharacterized protein (TIGR02996 family)
MQGSPMDERQTFENAIDENPLESTNHEVYADWLDEHGEPNEAAFRRSLGEWLRGSNSLIPYQNRGDLVYPWAISLHSRTERYPRGVSQEYMPEHVIGEESPATPSFHPRLFHMRYNWKNYRHMEEAFRQAFMKRIEEEKASKMARLTRLRMRRG